jgi:hypothetical protein
MRRVTRVGGTVAAYVWDFAGRRATSQHLSAAIGELEGADTAPALSADSTGQEKLQSLFESAGLTDVVTHPIDISVTFRDFDDYWNSNTRFASPVGSTVKALSEDKRQKLKTLLKAQLPIADNGTIAYTARVNGVRARA